MFNAELVDLVGECRELRNAVLDREVERLCLPRKGEVLAALQVLTDLGHSVDELAGAAASAALPAVTRSSVDAEALLPAAQRLVDQFSADSVAIGGVTSLASLMRDIQHGMDGLMDSAGVGW